MTTIDLTGQRFGRLVITGRAPNRPGSRIARWNAQCDCGATTTARGDHLRTGRTTSCGCYRREDSAKRRLIDLTGNRFGRLTVIRRAPNRNNQTRWHCRCDCGAEIISHGTNLASGDSRSCGCLGLELTATRSRKDRPGYAAAHIRLRITQGPAQQHTCVDCEQQACDWSYDGADPDELIQENGHAAGLRYSLDPEHYAPRCRPCHKAFDLAVRHG